jgi:5-methylcytosine-specific restriction endonuclease McrA
MTRRSRKHLTPEWQRVRNRVKPQLMALLPSACPRCGGVMQRGMKLDVGHISRSPALAYEPANLRLEHMSCNRRDGQRITTALRSTTRKEFPSW